jgi:hypothetical protein
MQMLLGFTVDKLLMDSSLKSSSHCLQFSFINLNLNENCIFHVQNLFVSKSEKSEKDPDQQCCRCGQCFSGFGSDF